MQTEGLWRRGTQLVVETPRGIELGVSLGVCQTDERPIGKVIRHLKPEDELLNHHLKGLSALAHERCVQWLADNGHSAILLAVEPLLDGQSLYFHFLSGIDELVQQQMEELVRLYEAEVNASDFVQRLIQGCGPDCGSETAAGRGCTSCSTCRACFSQGGRLPSKVAH